MDTKLRNNHKLAVFFIICVLVIPSFIMMGQYQEFYRGTEKTVQKARGEYLCSESFLKRFVEGAYVLYCEEDQEAQETVYDYFPDFLSWERRFQELYPFINYRIEDGEGNVIKESTSDGQKKLTEKNFNASALGIEISFDANGNPEVTNVAGEYEKSQEITLRRILGDPERLIGSGGAGWDFVFGGKLENRSYRFTMNQEGIDSFLKEEVWQLGHTLPESAAFTIMVLMAFAGMSALLFPLVKSFRTGDERIFHVPLEIALLIAGTLIAAVANGSYWIFSRAEGAVTALDFLIWMLVFAGVYWLVSCLRQIFVLGLKRYWKERTLTYRLWGNLKQLGRRIRKWGGKKLNQWYESLGEIDFNEESNRLIFKVVGINFLILLVVCALWFFGMFALVIYSVILFVILRKYLEDLKKKYAVLLKATNQIAEGNLDVTIEEDLGVFHPFKTEIQKIQSGLKKAVEEEVKSQRMKTELVTNVSHDLKTPLTAIITYVNLLKDEKDEQKRKDYLEVLERKSMRLKVLIEDLFEISKASSRDITLDIMDVDVVNLFKQVKLEQEDKIEKAGLDFRCSYPSEKLILPLDSQKTYRIFENLLVNIVKYAMPHTRVYIEIGREDKEVVIRMKNISAAELTFRPEEITERFVRGDASRNTEGSGLGLAIVKSFTELQKGTFRVETEADLFKAELRFSEKLRVSS